MNHRICFLTHNYRGLNSSGNKAKHDNEVTLREIGAVNLGVPTTYYDSKVASFFLDLAGVVKLSMTVRRGDIVVLQYPVKKYFAFVCNMAHAHGAKVVAIIHDLGSMRRRKLTVAKEIRRLMHADYVIASNATMKDWLSKNGFTNGLGALQLFDYRSASPCRERSAEDPETVPRVVYAGALSQRKNTFLLDMAKVAKGYDLEIFGNEDGLPGLKASEHVHLHDFMAADDFIANAPGDYGLVWDGDSLNTCSGHFGEYLRWNSPHKASFYLRAGLPLIVWRCSALAPIVKELGVGILIDRIEDIGRRLSAITPEERATMAANALSVAQRLNTGAFFKDAMKEAVGRIE